MVDQRRGRPSQWDTQQAAGQGSMSDLRTIMGNTRGGQPAAPPIENMEPIPGARPTRQVQRPRQPDAYSEQQYYQQAAPAPPSPAPGMVTLSEEELNKLKTITRDVYAQKETNARREAELRDKEEALRKGTQLLLDQRDAMTKKDEGLKARETELRAIAGELEKQAKKIAEKEASLAQQKNLLAEEDGRRKKFSENFRSREGALVQREQTAKSIERDLKLREQAVLGMEMDIKECPYCNVRYEFEGIQDLMDETRAYGLDLTELDKKFAKAKENMKREAYDQALESARGLLKDLKTLREDVLSKGVQYVIVSAANTVSQARTKGFDLMEADRHLAQARTAAAKNDFRTAEHYAKEADYMARDLMRQESLTPQPSALAPESPAPPMPPLEPTPQLPPIAAQKPPGRTAATPPEPQPRYEAPDTGPHYESAPPPRYEPVGDSGPQYQSVQQPQYEQAPEYGSQYDQQYQPPAEPAPPPAPAGPKKYSCSNCYAQFTIGTSQRPVKVNCPSCATTMIIRD